VPLPILLVRAIFEAPLILRHLRGRDDFNAPPAARLCASTPMGIGCTIFSAIEDEETVSKGTYKIETLCNKNDVSRLLSMT
jgi:hypothetical protein